MASKALGYPSHVLNDGAIGRTFARTPYVRLLRARIQWVAGIKKTGFRGTPPFLSLSTHPTHPTPWFLPRHPRRSRLGGSRGVPVLVPVRASPVPSVVRGSFVVKFFFPPRADFSSSAMMR